MKLMLIIGGVILVVAIFFMYSNTTQVGGAARGAPFALPEFGKPGLDLHEGDVYPKDQCGGNPHGHACKFLYDKATSDRDCIGASYPLDHAYDDDNGRVASGGYNVNF